MEFLSFFLYAVSIVLIRPSNAFPLLSPENSSDVDRQIVNSQYFLGIIGLVTIFSIIGACLCCKRRKRGFEEFKNETVPGENHRSEFPIFRALSPEQQEHNRIVACANNSPVAIVPGNQHNVSRERLFDEDVDNNNTTLSQADLENIQNNNAVDYIPNLNEAEIMAAAGDMAAEPLNVVAAAAIYQTNNNNIVFESHQTSSSSVNIIQQQIESQPSPPSPIALPIPINEIECQIVSVYSNYHHQAPQLPPPPSLYLAQQPIPFSNNTLATSDLVNSNSNNNTCVELFKSQNHHVDDELNTGGVLAPGNPFISEIQHELENVIMNSSSNVGSATQPHEIKSVIDLDETTIITNNNNNNNISNISNSTNLIRPRDECSSMHSISSEKSNNSLSDINSVEEALLALDNALADEDTPGHDDEDYEDDVTIGNDESNIFQHLLKSTSANSNDITTTPPPTKEPLSCINVKSNSNNDSYNKEEFVNLVKVEAIKLVDHVLSESEKFISNHNEAILDNNCSFICTPVHENDDVEEEPGTPDKEVVNSNTINKNTSDIEGDSSSMLNQTVIDLTMLGDKTTALRYSNNESIDNLLLNMSSHDTDDFNPVSSTPLVKAIMPTESCSVELRDNLQNKFNNIYDTFVTTEGRIIPNNATFAFDDSDIGCAPLSNETFDQLPPPEIKIDREETNSEDMTTVTPVNTPIELNYSIDTWDKFVTNSMNANQDVTFDVNQPSTSGIHLKKNNTLSVNDSGGGGGWFLHPPNNSQSTQQNDETFDVEEDDEENLNMTYEALRKQLAEVLPHAQGMQGPAEYSDEEDSSTQNDRTFDEYRSPLNKCDELDEALVASLPPPPNEIIINYKRPLSPILEESEDETCKTFVLNETKCLDSTSPGYMESGDELLGVSKPLMASNDTLFNLEDTLGDDLFSPRATSQTDLSKIPPILDAVDNVTNSDLANLDIQNATVNLEPYSQNVVLATDNPANLTLNFELTKKFRSFELLSEEGVAGTIGNGTGDLCSPDQAKTFSEDIALTEAQSSDLSMTVDQDATYTTVEEKTCVTVNGGGILNEEHVEDELMMNDDNVFTDTTFLKENERISEISEPEWEVTYSEKEKNPDEHSLLGLDSLELLLDNDEGREKNDNDTAEKNINTIESEEKLSEFSFNSQRDKDEGISSSKDESENNDDETSDDDCNNSTKKYCNTTSSTSSSDNNDDDDKNESVNQQPNFLVPNDNRQNDGSASEFHQLNKNVIEFINKEIEYNSSQYYSSQNYLNANDNSNANFSKDSGMTSIIKTQATPTIRTGYNKMPAVIGNNNYSRKVLIPNSEGYLIEYNETNGNEKYHNQIDLIRPNKYQPLFVNNGGVYDLDLENYDNGMIINHHHHHNHHAAYLSGEDDPWSGYQLENGGSGGGGDGDDGMYCNSQDHQQAVASTAFNLNEWESDEEDDSNSSEEFMYVKGNTNINSSPLTKKSQELKNKYNNYQNLGNIKNNNDKGNEDKDIDDDDEDDVWATHQDQIPVAGDKGPVRESEDESCDDSSSDVEGEFIPSSWDAEAQPARSALKSPDKSSSTKKQRSVAFKKQRYHSVYEYPREVIPLSPAYSEPQMWDRNSAMNRFENTSDYNLDDDDVLDGWKVSSSTRPFHGSQFSPQCNTWPTDSDFSWSQLLSCNDDQNIKYQDYTERQIEWPSDFGDFFGKIEDKETNFDDEVQRPDSGVGESAELLSESVSLGDLKHTKSLLRLPLNVSSVITNENSDNSNSIKLDDDEIDGNKPIDNFIIPTPSFTGSMDSLSTSSNGSDRPITFTTFGKAPILPTTNEQIENNRNTPAIVVQPAATTLLLIDTISNDLKDVLEIKDSTTNHDRTKRQSDSTDEDSGIENLTRLAK